MCLWTFCGTKLPAGHHGFPKGIGDESSRRYTLRVFSLSDSKDDAAVVHIMKGDSSSICLICVVSEHLARAPGIVLTCQHICPKAYVSLAVVYCTVARSKRLGLRISGAKHRDDPGTAEVLWESMTSARPDSPISVSRACRWSSTRILPCRHFRL